MGGYNPAPSRPGLSGRAETSDVKHARGEEVLTARERPPGTSQDLYDYPEVYAALRAPAEDLLAGVRRIIATYAHPPGRTTDGPLRLLDPACGPANWLVPFALEGHHVAGNDLSREMVRGARAALGRLGVSHEIVQGDMRRLALSSGPFDVALEIAGSTGLLMERDDLVGLLQGVADHLRPNGIFAVTVFLDRREEAVDAAYPRLIYESPWIPVELADGHVGAARARYEHLGWSETPPSASMRRTVAVRDLPDHPDEIVEDYTLRAWRLAEALAIVSATARYDVLEIDALGPDAPDDPLGESTFVLRRR